MDEDEVNDEVEVKNSINAWRQSERKIMIETVQDLIQTSHKYAKSQYTPNAQRVRWTKLAGQLIWYKDQILKNFSLEAMTIQLEALQKRMIESDEQRASEHVQELSDNSLSKARGEESGGCGEGAECRDL